MHEIIEPLLQYIPTAVVTLILGLIAQRVIRAGKRDEVTLQREADAATTRLRETEIVIASLRADVQRGDDRYEQEHEWRLKAEDKADSLRLLVVGQVEAAASTAFPPEPPQ